LRRTFKGGALHHHRQNILRTNEYFHGTTPG
jgi:hypothetical protein